MTRRTSPSVATSPGCAPLRAMYEAAVAARARRWTDVEPQFLSAMWDFDDNFARGVATQGDNQNGKGDYFTDLIALLLEHCSGKELHGRGSVSGLIFPTHALDATYPDTGVVEVLVETKVAGAPKTPRNPRQNHPNGRPGAADLDKRIKETAFKTIDLKAEWARHDGHGGGPTADFVTWLRRSKPSSFLFMAIRVVDRNDLERTQFFARAAAQVMDGVGVIAYGPQPGATGYVSQPVGSDIQLDRVLARLCTALRALP